MNARTAVFVLVALTVAVIALSTGTTVYYLLAIMPAMMALLSLASVLATLATLHVTTTAQRRRVSRGDSVSISLTVGRRSFMPVGSVELEVSTPGENRDVGRMSVSVPPLKSRQYRYNIRCAHRGLYEVGVSRVSVTDVFGLFTFSKHIKGSSARVMVVPRPRSIAPMSIRPGDMGPQGRVRMTEDRASPASVRAWQDGDSMKNIHWKLTARRRELLVRTFEESARPDVLILMDCAPVNALKSHVRTIEDVLCEAAAGAALSQMTAGYTVRMPLNTTKPAEPVGQSVADIGRFLEVLTPLSFDSPYSFEQVIALEMRRLQRTGALIVVTTRMNPTLAELAMRIDQLGVQVRYIWVAEVVHADHETLKKRLELAGIDVETVNPWQSAPARGKSAGDRA